jgi:predicted RNA-binding protein
MSKVIIKADKLKPQALNATGRQEFNIDEYIYIKSFNYDDNNVIKVRYYVLLKTSESEFTKIDDITYFLTDDKSFSDVKSFTVYKTDENGEVIYEDITTTEVDEDGVEIDVVKSMPVKRMDDFSRNFTAFSSLIIPSIFTDVNNHLGYHPNENGIIDPIEEDSEEGI